MTLKEKCSCPLSSQRMLHYRLYTLTSEKDSLSFYLEIQLESDRFFASLKTTDLKEAKRIYSLLLKSKVTPCTAQDVLADICP